MPDRSVTDRDAPASPFGTPQTAMLLTDEEWDDLTFIVSWYADATAKFAHLPELDDSGQRLIVHRRRSLAARIIAANEPVGQAGGDGS